ncbi:MAG: hypothetical protein ACJ77A_00675 [Actinomycetota bacterium]
MLLGLGGVASGVAGVSRPAMLADVTPEDGRRSPWPRTGSAATSGSCSVLSSRV